MSKQVAGGGGGGIGILGPMFLIFLTLKLVGVIDWSWWWVTAPLWVPFALIAAFALLAFGAFLVYLLFPSQRRRRAYRKSRPWR